MKRKNKNILMLLILVVLLLGSFLTICYMKESSNNFSVIRSGIDSTLNIPGDQNNDNSYVGEPPAKPTEKKRY